MHSEHSINVPWDVLYETTTKTAFKGTSLKHLLWLMGKGPDCFRSFTCTVRNAAPSHSRQVLLIGTSPQTQPPAFSADICTVLLRGLVLGSGSPSKPIIHLWYAAVLIAPVPFHGSWEDRTKAGWSYPSSECRTGGSTKLAELCALWKTEGRGCSLPVSFFWSGLVLEWSSSENCWTWKAGVCLYSVPAFSASHLLLAWPFLWLLLAAFASPLCGWLAGWINASSLLSSSVSPSVFVPYSLSLSLCLRF